MERLAGVANVYLKVGGIGMALFGIELAQAARPPVLRRAGGRLGGRDALVHRPLRTEPLHVRVELPRRPRGCSYVVLWNTFKKTAALGGYDAAETAALFHDTAAHAYSI